MEVDDDEGVHRWSLREAGAVHDPARLDRGHEVVGVCRPAERGEARCVRGAHHPDSRRDRRPRGDRARRRRVRRRARRARPARCPRVRDRDRPGGARLRAPGRSPRVLVRVAHHARRPGRLLVEAQGAREHRRPAREARPLRRPRRPGGGVPAGVRQRHPLDGRARQRPRGGREPGSARLEPACRRPDPREQPHQARGLRAVHGRGARERRARPRGAGDRRPPVAVGARARCSCTLGRSAAPDERCPARSAGSGVDPWAEREDARGARGCLGWWSRSRSVRRWSSVPRRPVCWLRSGAWPR